MKKMREKIEQLLFKVDYLIGKVYFDLRYFGVKHYIKKIRKKIRLKVIFEPMHHWTKGRIEKKIEEKIKEIKDDEDKKPH